MNEFGNAVWIGSSHPFDLHEVYVDFRAPVVQGRVGDVVELLISADSRYKLWLNGQFVARGPARSYPHAQSFDRLDLSQLWVDGANQVAVQVYQPGYSHFSYVHRAAAGLLATLSANGDPILVSDAAWRVRRNPSFASAVPRVSIYGSGVESRNLELDDAWQLTKYSADGWDNARVIAAANGHIWSGLHERITPMLVENSADIRLVESRLSDDDMWLEDAHWNVRDAWMSGETTEFSVDKSGWIRPILDFDSSALWLVDLGRAYTCQAVVEVRGASGGEIINISYADKMIDGELVISDPQTYCRVQMTDTFALRQGTQLIEPFNMRGGRYVLLQVSGEVGDRFALRLSVTVASYPLAITHLLTTEQPELYAILTMCENTVRACLQDSFVDCVWRESSQWLGDGLIQAKTLAAMCDDFRPMRKLLGDCAAGAYADGILPGVGVSETHAYTIPRYSLMWVELLAFYHGKTDDSAFVREMWPVLLALLETLWHSRDQRGLLVNSTGRRHYIDWSATSQADPHAVINLHFVLALQQAARLAEIVEESAETHHTRASTLLQQCRAVFWVDGVWQDDLAGSTHSQLAAAMGLLIGAVEPSEQDTLLAAIIARSLNPSDTHEDGAMVLASPFMHHYLFEALAKFGRNQAIIDIIKLRWGRWAAAGEPTTWENWNIDFPDGSACHAFSAHPRYHLERAIQQLSHSATRPNRASAEMLTS